MEKRKNFLIKKKFQFNFMGSFVFLLISESILIVSLFLYFTQDTITTGYVDSVLKVEQTNNFFFVQLILMMIVVAFGIALAGMLIFIFLSHRLAGPIYRFEQTLKQMDQGNLDIKIKLRKNDQFSELENILNQFSRSLNHRIQSVKLNVDEIKSLIVNKNDPAALSKVNDKLEVISKEISHFKASSPPNG